MIFPSPTTGMARKLYRANSLYANSVRLGKANKIGSHHISERLVETGLQEFPYVHDSEKVVLWVDNVNIHHDVCILGSVFEALYDIGDRNVGRKRNVAGGCQIENVFVVILDQGSDLGRC